MAEPQYTVAVGTHPKGVAGGSLGFYVGLFDTSELALFDGANGLQQWQQGTGLGRTNGVATWGDYVVTTNRDSGTATLHDASTGAMLAVIQVGSLPWGVAAADGRAFVANFGDGTVTIIDLVQAQVVETVSVGADPVTAAPGDGRVYILHLDGQVTMLNGQGQTLAQGQSDAYNAFGIAADPLRNRVYVGSRDGRVAVLSGDTLAQVGGWSLPGPAYALAVNPATGRLYAVDATNDRLYVIEPDGSGVGQISLPPQDADEGGQGIAAWGNRIAVANYAAGTLTVIRDTTCSSLLTPSPAPPQMSIASQLPVGAQTASAAPTAARAAAAALPAGSGAPRGLNYACPLPDSGPGVSNSDLFVHTDPHPCDCPGQDRDRVAAR